MTLCEITLPLPYRCLPRPEVGSTGLEGALRRITFEVRPA
jgi:hypothetical protein